MVTHVVLNGSLISDAEPILEDAVGHPVRFHPISDSADEAELHDLLTRADVVVGDWPDVGGEYGVQLVQQVGAGVDNYRQDSIPATAYLCNVYGHENGVAEHVFALLLAVRRRLLQMDGDLREGEWPESDVMGAVQEIRGQTMGIIGLGRIGRALIEPANAFGLDLVGILGHEPDGAPPDGVRSVGGPETLDETLETSDVVVLSLPLNEDTTGLIGEQELDLIGPEGYLINVARGDIVDEQALYEALEDGRIAGAGIDTWYCYPTDREQACPPSSYPFAELDNLVMTPHIGGWTEATATHRWEFIAANIDRITRGERPENVVWEPRID